MINILSFCLVISVSALLPAIDLLEALELPTNHSRYIGVSITQGMEKHLIAFKLGKIFHSNYVFSCNNIRNAFILLIILIHF